MKYQEEILDRTGSMKYRKDIDGLRSIAVSLVVLHHAGVHLISGGYVGVDVFFVLSGYLITGIIYQQLLKDSFSFSEFYIRRIRRLMPALFGMIFVTTVFALVFLFPSDLLRYSNSLLWVSFYLGNFFFWREHGGYFAENTQEAPLLHTWSLAVEEQYYLIWPVYVILGIRFLGFKYFSLLTIAGLLAAIYVSEWATQNTIGAAYYLLPTRFFELMVGSILALQWDKLPRAGASFNHVLSLAGLALIVYAALMLTPASDFPGYNALYPAIGSAMLLYSGRNNPGVINKLLSLRPFVFIGLISYSLYLWHWPVFVFLRYTAIELTPVVQLLAVALSLALAYLSWRFIETPFRTASPASLSRVSFDLLAKPMAAVLVIWIAIFSLNGIPARFSAEVALMDEALNSRPNRIRLECHSPSRDFALLPNESCTLGQEDGNQTTGFIFGDSHANHITGFLDVLGKDAGSKMQDYTMDQCPPIFGFAWGRSRRVANMCEERNGQVREYINAHNFDFIVLSASWPSPFSERLYVDGELLLDSDQRMTKIREQLATTIEEIENTGAIPILFDDVSSVVAEDPRCPIKKAVFDEARICTTAQDINSLIVALFTELEERFSSIRRVRPADLYCTEAICELAINGIPIYHDADHLNDVAARELAKTFLETHANPFLIKDNPAR
ncbi:MAG: hypothetical protein COA78_36660 [Blastopirellula sp.]|nr:MAG: hypothetical protein COA78_36660 [Blastopirellula sp.]